MVAHDERRRQSAHQATASSLGIIALANDGNPSETLIRAKQERLDNWHTLQELAGII
jgi:hypothetical protein